ncbi:MAG: M48 family metalloprotease [Planctomycetota bacterium]
MIFSLPAETVFEAKRKARRSALVMFVILLVIYGVSFNLMVVVGGFALVVSAGLGHAVGALFHNLWQVNLVALGAGALVALWHFVAAWRRPLHRMLALLGAVPVDPKDAYHRRFAGAVGEAEIATGVRPIVPMILRSTGSNACSAKARDGAAICVTEGLLARLTRPELTAVVAHEAARIANDDSRLTTTACSLVNVFDRITKSTGACFTDGRAMLAGGAAHHAGCVAMGVGLVASVAHGLLGFVYMAVSRGRGHLADAHAVQMSKDPLALAEALAKISRGYRGVGELKAGYEALFIVDPRPVSLAEERGVVAALFSTHPPTKRRLERLVAWAGADASGLRPPRRERIGPRKVPGTPKEQDFYAYQDGEWKGPYLPMQMLAMGILTPQVWIAAAAGSVLASSSGGGPTAGIMRACENPLLLPLFKLRTMHAVTERRCPRCKVPLVERDYEGAPTLQCTFCKGHLLGPGVLERLIARREKGFTEAELADARKWRSVRRGPVKVVCGFPEVTCPLCGKAMGKRFHSVLVKVVIDVCNCRAIWCDGGELERIQILVEQAGASPR